MPSLREATILIANLFNGCTRTKPQGSPRVTEVLHYRFQASAPAQHCTKPRGPLCERNADLVGFSALFCGVPALLARLLIALATHWDPPGAGTMAEPPLIASAN